LYRRWGTRPDIVGILFEVLWSCNFANELWISNYVPVSTFYHGGLHLVNKSLLKKTILDPPEDDSDAGSSCLIPWLMERVPHVPSV